MISTAIELRAGDASAMIAPDEGGMLLSLRVGGHELLVQRRAGTEPVPMFGSFLMAPWVGELSFGQIDFGGQHAQIQPNKGRHAIHGLVATGPWEVADVGPSAAKLVRKLGLPWPFGGIVTQDINLDADGVTLEAEIRAEDQAMPAALGWHPWFACPDPDLVRICLHAESELELDDELLPTGAARPVASKSDLRGAPILGDRRLDTVFVGASSPALLRTPDVELQIHFDPAIENVVVYTSPGAVCIEPWSAWPDAFRMADAGYPSGVRILEPGESLKRWTRWEWSLGMDNGAEPWVPSVAGSLPSHWTKSAEEDVAMRTWRVGIVGWGWAAGAHLTALERVPNVEVRAICTSRTDVQTGQGRGPESAAPEIIADFDQLIARDDIDVVDICSRSNLHAAQGIAAARTGKHVIIEKPIALSLGELRDLQSAVAEAGVRTCVCFEERFSDQFTATKSFLDNDMIGPLHYAEVDYYHEVGPSVRQYEWNRLKIGGGSSLLSCGCHAVDGLLLFMGASPVEVTSYTTRSPNPVFARYEYPTSSVSIIRFDNDAIGKVASIIDSYQPYHLRVHLVGSDGALVDGKFWSTRIAGLDPDQWSDLGVKLETSADVVHHPYLQQFRAFFSALDEGREMPLTSLAEAAKSFELVFAADRSAELGRPVRMTEVEEATQ